MDAASAMGIEQFVVDAGWWSSINGADPTDFAHGYGTYDVDTDRFPNGLGGLSDYAHGLGLRFGVWVEPERVDRATVGKPGGAADRMLAMQDGRYDSGRTNATAVSAQVCFVDPQARDWIMGRLSSLIDQAHPDYLKWDNNFWINCNRAGHGHGVADGNFLHIRGVDIVRDALRSRYPDLEIEDCASGGNRLSLDMLQYSDTTWISDRTFPSSRARHNLEGLLDIFPAPYLLTFEVDSAEEPMNGDPGIDLSMLLRSRMSGALGLSAMLVNMPEGAQAEVGGQIGLYKYIRPILTNSTSMLLSRQQVDYPDAPWSGWDVVEHLSTTGDAVVMAFDTPDAESSTLVRPKGLRTDVTYRVESADYGDLGSVTGADLMNQGIQINTSDLSHSHVLIFRAQQIDPDRR